MKFNPIPPRIFLLSAYLLVACTSPSSPEPSIVPASQIPISTNTPLPTDTPQPTSTPPDPVNPLPGSDGLGDPYYPLFGNGGYDVLHYTIEIDVDMYTNIITGTVTIFAQATQDLSQFNLDFLGFEISEISINSQAATFERSGAELIINLNAPFARTETFTVSITYSGEPGEDLPPELEKYEVGWINYGEGVLVAGEPSGSSGWYPVNEHPLDKAAYTFIITVEEPYIVAANGVLQETIDNGATRTFIWESPDPIASYLVTVAIAKFDVETETGPNGIRIRNYFGVGVSNRVRNDFDVTADMIAYFTSIFGPYPFETYGVVVHDLRLGFALETQTLSVFGNSFTNEIVVVHELAHQWFGDSVTLESWQDIWLNEGFATYASVLWREHAFGQFNADQELRDYYAGIAIGEPVLHLSPFELADYLERFPLDEELISPQDTAAALQALFGHSLTDTQIDEVTSLIPDQGTARNELPKLILQMNIGTMDIPASHIRDFLISIGLEDALDLAPSDYPPPGDPTADSLFNRSVYHRGALTLHALRLRVGDDAFFTILTAFAQRFKNSNASTADFIAIAEEISGQDLDDFFFQWLYAQDIPDIPEMDLFREDYLLPD